ncbi:transglutaminase domain-containing protein [Mycoplasma tullyi]|uniref:Transglutaminase domain-containing protein n=1 Tax=Mycoplasma tullyi TaxID=1612150 RepID=A0A7D7YHN2_9MOLU|nr:transglutaminase-like domain-containing protein [Mycoplasma tullyi]QMT98798.1 transglutaminase domain-containing protein [Mycoplasma tullyi]
MKKSTKKILLTLTTFIPLISFGLTSCTSIPSNKNYDQALVMLSKLKQLESSVANDSKYNGIKQEINDFIKTNYFNQDTQSGKLVSIINEMGRLYDKLEAQINQKDDKTTNSEPKTASNSNTLNDKNPSESSNSNLNNSNPSNNNLNTNNETGSGEASSPVYSGDAAERLIAQKSSQLQSFVNDLDSLAATANDNIKSGLEHVKRNTLDQISALRYRGDALKRANEYDDYAKNQLLKDWEVVLDDAQVKKNLVLNQKNEGNAPLKQGKKYYSYNNEEDINDLMDMFDKIVNEQQIGTISFGDVQIEAQAMSKAYYRWIREKWRDYPWLGFNNGVFFFHLKGNDSLTFPNTKENVLEKTYYVDNIVNGIYASDWLSDNQYRDNFKYIINEVNSLIKDGMSDIEKAAALYWYVLEKSGYDYKFSNPARAYFNNGGVCADFGSFYAFILNMVGIEAIPHNTGAIDGEDYDKLVNAGLTKDNGQELHELVWMRLKNPKDNKYYWFRSDPTWGDSMEDKWDKAPHAKTGIGWNMDQFISPLGLSPWQPFSSENGDRTQFDYNNLWGLPLREHIVDNGDTKGYYSTRNDFVFRHNLFQDEVKTGQKLSKPFFYKGKWFYLQKTYQGSNGRGPATFSFKYRNFLDDTSKDVFNSTDPAAKAISDALSSYKSDLLGNSQYSAPLTFERNNKVIFVIKNFNYLENRAQNSPSKLVILDLDTLKTRTVDLPLVGPDRNGRRWVDNFYFDASGDLYVKFDKDDALDGNVYPRHFKLTITDELKNYLASTTPSKQEALNWVNRIRGYSAVYLEDGSVGNLPKVTDNHSLKVQLLSDLSTIKAQIENGTDVNYASTITKIKNLYKSFLSHKIVSSNKLFVDKQLSEYYQFSKSRYDGESFRGLTNFNVIQNPDDIFSRNDSILYDVYYSETKNGTFKKIKSDQYIDNLTISKQEQPNLQGYYYVVAHAINDPNNSVRSDTTYVEYVSNTQRPKEEYALHPILSGLKVGFNYGTTVQTSNIQLNVIPGVEQINNQKMSHLYFNWYKLTLQIPGFALSLNNFSNASFKVYFIPFSDVNAKKVVWQKELTTTDSYFRDTNIDVDAREPGIYYSELSYTYNNQDYKAFSEISTIFGELDNYKQTLTKFFDDMHQANKSYTN